MTYFFGTSFGTNFILLISRYITLFYYLYSSELFISFLISFLANILLGNNGLSNIGLSISYHDNSSLKICKHDGRITKKDKNF